MTAYTPADYAALLARLRAHSDEGYRKFNESLMPGTENTYGVRAPVLRALAKEHPESVACPASRGLRLAEHFCLGRRVDDVCYDKLGPKERRVDVALVFKRRHADAGSV